MNFAAEVGPEFLGEVAECVEEDVGAPDGHGVAKVALIGRMVGVGDAGGDGVADDFGVIELRFATVGASDEDTADGIFDAVPGAAGAELEVTRVLMKKGGEDGGGHEGADGGVGVSGGVALAVALEALAVGGIAVASLAHQSDCTEEGDGDGIGHGLHGELEFCFGRKSSEFVVTFDGGVVSEDVEEAIVF